MLVKRLSIQRLSFAKKVNFSEKKGERHFCLVPKFMLTLDKIQNICARGFGDLGRRDIYF